MQNYMINSDVTRQKITIRKGDTTQQNVNAQASYCGMSHQSVGDGLRRTSYEYEGLYTNGLTSLTY